jgi:hypothetical protein
MTISVVMGRLRRTPSAARPQEIIPGFGTLALAPSVNAGSPGYGTVNGAFAAGETASEPLTGIG